MAHQFQISRRLTPESRELLRYWQDNNLYTPSAKFNTNPTIAVVSRKLVAEFFMSKPKELVQIPDALKRPISMLPNGISVRPPLGRTAMLNMVFEDPGAFTQQRRQLLEANGGGARVGHYNPNLHVGNLRNEDITLEMLADAVNNRPPLLEFMPAEVEAI